MENTTILSFERILRKIKIFEGNQVSYSTERPKGVDRELEFLSSQYSVTSGQVLLLTVLLDLCGFGTVSVSELSRAMKCSFFSFLSLKRDLDALRDKDLVEGVHAVGIPEDLISSIADNRPHTIRNLSGMSTRRILDRMKVLFDAVAEKVKSPSVLLRTTDMMILTNPSTSLAMACDMYGVLSYGSIPEECPCGPSEGFCDEDRYTDAMDKNERLLFYCILVRFVFLGEDSTSWYDLSPYFSPAEIRTLMRDAQSGMLTIQTSGIMETVRDDGTEMLFRISGRVKEHALADTGGAPRKPFFPKIIRSESIVSRRLFYPQSVEDRVRELVSILDSGRFMKVREGLVNQGLRTGFAVLFYGSPGTGKTETAYQIARSTGRDMIAVDVSDLKTSYVGETEKNVKNLFDRYRSHVSESGSFPILLFNEADAVLGKRTLNVSGAADRMENSMQNIILQEMENLDGIMIATTNLTSNLDKAFDRRFLYRIHFPRPDTETVAGIFASLIPQLDAGQAMSLASEFQLSGGQIENVCRRRAVMTAVTGREITFPELRALCAEESADNSGIRKVGF